MRQKLKICFLLLVLFCILNESDGWGRRRRRWFGRRRRRWIPPIRIPPIRIPIIRKIRIPPIRKIIRTVGKVTKTVVKKIGKVGKTIVNKVTGLVKGCCGLHPKICQNEKEFKNRKVDIQKKTKNMDRDWIQGI